MGHGPVTTVECGDNPCGFTSVLATSSSKQNDSVGGPATPSGLRHSQGSSGKWGEGAGAFAAIARVLSVDGEGDGSGSQDTCATSGQGKRDRMIPFDVTGLKISSVLY